MLSAAETGSLDIRRILMMATDFVPGVSREAMTWGLSFLTWPGRRSARTRGRTSRSGVFSSSTERHRMEAAEEPLCESVSIENDSFWSIVRVAAGYHGGSAPAGGFVDGRQIG